MSKLKDQDLLLIQQKARRKLALLSKEYIQAKPEEREAIQAGIRFERWMLASSQEILDGRF